MDTDMIKWDEYPLNLLSKEQVEKAVAISTYTVFDINARELLTAKRFDIYAKLLYIDHKTKGVDMTYALNVYKKHIEIITGYSYTEFGSPEKNSFEKYVEQFNQLIETFQQQKFDTSRSLIPIDANNVPIDGSHRVSCAVYFNQVIRVVKFTKYERPAYTCEWFEKNHLIETVARAIALEFCNWHPDIYMACLWPSAYNMKEKRKEATRLMQESVNVVSCTSVSLGQNGLRNLLIQIYGFMDWTGTAPNHFRGIYGKLNEISSIGNGTVRFILFQAKGLEQVLELKEKIRNIFGLGKGAIHITDKAEETRQIARLVYNPNSIHHLKNACPDKYLKSWDMCMAYKKALQEKGYDLQNYIIDSSMVMAIYGIREAGDLDFYTTDPEVNKASLHSMKLSFMECHDKYAIYHGMSVKDMVYIPENYFVFNDLKFLALQAIKEFKQKKGEKKDLLDVQLIDSFRTDNDRWKYNILLLQNYFRRKQAHATLCAQNLVRLLLLRLHLLGFAKRILKRNPQ